MAITKDDLGALQLLIREELKPLEAAMSGFRGETLANFDAVFKKLETQEHEYLSLRHQMAELEKKCA